MANNAGRQGGANGQMNEHVEFTVKAEEDLYLTGSENTIRRVTAETNYSCLMLKTQRFSSLFRHYAKYHGLRKDDLEYYFVNPLENEDTPESVQLQRGDTIMVRKRRKAEPHKAAADDEEFFRDMKELLDDDEHMDAVFLVHKEAPAAAVVEDQIKKEEVDAEIEYEKIRGHKCILTARGDYFKAHFRKSAGSTGTNTLAFREGTQCEITVDQEFSPQTVRYMLEFLYTNRISTIVDASTESLLNLLHLSDRWLLRDLKRLVELELISSHMDVNTVARMYCATEDYHADRLSKACIDFIMENIRDVTANASFQKEMQNYPNLIIPILNAAADLIPEPLHKKARLGEHSSSTALPTPAPSSSSPVPDSVP